MNAFECITCFISTHTPHARRDSILNSESSAMIAFQLTRLMRGVTDGSETVPNTRSFQLTRLMRGVT